MRKMHGIDTLSRSFSASTRNRVQPTKNEKGSNPVRKKYGALLAVLAILAIVFTFVNTGAASAQAVSSTAKMSTNTVTSGSMSVSEKTVALPAASTEGCPLGDACIYPENKGWNGGHPSLMFYYYGVYPFDGKIIPYQNGNHYIFNNQTDGALFWLCTDSNGNTCPKYQPTGTWSNFNLGPIYSVKLTDKNNHV